MSIHDHLQLQVDKQLKEWWGLLAGSQDEPTGAGNQTVGNDLL